MRSGVPRFPYMNTTFNSQKSVKVKKELRGKGVLNSLALITLYLWRKIAWAYICFYVNEGFTGSKNLLKNIPHTSKFTFFAPLLNGNEKGHTEASHNSRANHRQ